MRNPELLATYLNDHYAGATAGLELAQRLAGAEKNVEYGAPLQRIAEEIRDDRDELAEIMATLGVSIRRPMVAAAWVAEKITRLKPNGRLLTRSPLSTLIELEALRLGVEGKAAGWRTLQAAAAADGRLNAERLTELIDRALRQSETLERLRTTAAAALFAASSSAEPG